MPGYRFYVGELRTGKINRSVDLSGRWTTSFDYGVAGTIEGTVALRAVDPETGARIWPGARADTSPAKQFLAVSYIDDKDRETFLEAGPIWTTRYRDSTGELQIGASGLSSYFDHRKLIPVLAAAQDPADIDMTYTEEQLGLIAKRLVEEAQAHTAGSLPIVLPDDSDFAVSDGSTHTRTFFGYELGWVGERLKQLTEVIDGPEIQFVPRRRSDDPRFLEWEMRIGVEPSMMLTQTGPAWIFDRTVEESSVRDIDISASGSSMATRFWAAGEGEAQGRPIIYEDSSELLDLGWPLLEGEVPSTDTVSELGTLRGHARESLAISSRPVETWTATVSRDGRPNLGQYRPGDWTTLRLRDHDFQPDGDYSMRMLALAGASGSDDVSVTLSERLGAI